MRNIFPIFSCTLLLCMFAVFEGFSQKSPIEYYGFQPGDDFKFLGYEELLNYYKHLDQSSKRVKLEYIGTSELGRPLIILLVSSSNNITNLTKYKNISRQQALAKIPNEQSIKNAREGKAVVWIDAGLHATERATSQMIPSLAYDLSTSEDREFRKIRDRVITIIMPVMNPDGLDIVENWYKENLGTPYETTSPPWLYHYYAGHDNNRDWFMNNLKETRAVNNILYNEWYPQIVHNHHQTSPSWARIFVPPFADPVNPNIHPAIVTGTNMVGMAMADRLALKNMPGVVSNYRFSMWWNGGMRTVPYFHNMIGILTETAHATPTPRRYDESTIPKYIGGQFPSDGSSVFYSNPWKGGESKFAGAVNYMYEASMALLNLAADRKESLLSNIYSMGRDQIEDPNKPYAYVIPRDQHDFGEAYHLVELLKIGGVEIHELKKAVTVAGERYEEGSIIIYGAQSFHPYVRDLLTKQEYPVQKKYPGGPVKPPYDLAGWTLPLQMGLKVDEIMEQVELATSALTIPFNKSIPVEGTGTATQWSSNHNDAYALVNRLIKAGYEVFIDKQFQNFSTNIAADQLKVYTKGLYVTLKKVSPLEEETMISISKRKIGLYKSWVANMDEGWTRFVLDQFDFDYDTLHDRNIIESDLQQYDIIILPSQSERKILNGHTTGTMPREYCGGLGIEGTAKLKSFVENGGVVMSFDAASNFLINQYGLPLRNTTRGVKNDDFFIPGSLVGIELSTNHPLAMGMQERTVASFARSGAFEVVKKSNKGEGGLEYTVDNAPIPNVEEIARYASSDILKSGYALNPEKYIGGKLAMVAVPQGKGKFVLFGFRPQFRGQSHSTYKLIFNAILLSEIYTNEMAE